MNTRFPLASIIVITYHSEKYVLETLESAKTQTYQNIELIISDDGSTDNTIQICKDWLAQNKDRFVRTELITVEKNTGIPANCNRGVKAAQGEWIKLIAGDDILLDNCITDNVAYVLKNTDVKVLFSKLQYFVSNNENYVYKKISPEVHEIEKYFNAFISAADQHKLLLTSYFVPTPSSFINKNVFVNANYFDERFPLIEDYPFWLKVTSCMVKLCFMDNTTIYYRIHNESVYNGELAKNNLVNKELLRNEIWKQEYIYPYYSSYGILKNKYQYFINLLFCNKKNNLFNRILYKLLNTYLNPFHYLQFILRNINKDWQLKKSIRNLS